jgi:glutamate 5-kinase
MPSTPLRKKVLAKAKRIVLKLGTQLLTRADSLQLDVRFIRKMADQIVELRQAGKQVTVVCSGAIGAGCGALGMKQRPTNVADLQAMAAVGQRLLMTHFHDAFGRHNIEVGQMLLTREDFDDRARFLNLRNCLIHLEKLGCVPVINENDAVAVDELRFGDNDLLAALVTNALPADALVVLSVVDGLLDGDGQVIDLVDDARSAGVHARKDSTAMGSGGILTKLEAARQVTEAGEIAVIANGRAKNVLPRLFAAESIGTVFVPASRKLDSRARWIGLTKRPAGTLTIDDGAVAALCSRGRSLLAIGVLEATGRFKRGDVLSVKNKDGGEVSRGLSNYNAKELKLIVGKRSNQFEKILGRAAYPEVIHRDNLVMTSTRI